MTLAISRVSGFGYTGHKQLYFAGRHADRACARLRRYAVIVGAALLCQRLFKTGGNGLACLGIVYAGLRGAVQHIACYQALRRIFPGQHGPVLVRRGLYVLRRSHIDLQCIGGQASALGLGYVKPVVLVGQGRRLGQLRPTVAGREKRSQKFAGEVVGFDGGGLAVQHIDRISCRRRPCQPVP